MIRLNAQLADPLVRHESLVGLDQHVERAVAGNVPAGDARETALTSEFGKRLEMLEAPAAVRHDVFIGNAGNLEIVSQGRALLTILDGAVCRHGRAPADTACIDTAHARADAPEKVRTVAGPVTDAPVLLPDVRAEWLQPTVSPGKAHRHHIVAIQMR